MELVGCKMHTYSVEPANNELRKEVSSFSIMCVNNSISLSDNVTHSDLIIWGSSSGLIFSLGSSKMTLTRGSLLVALWMCSLIALDRVIADPDRSLQQNSLSAGMVNVVITSVVLFFASCVEISHRLRQGGSTHDSGSRDIFSSVFFFIADCLLSLDWRGTWCVGGSGGGRGDQVLEG